MREVGSNHHYRSLYTLLVNMADWVSVQEVKALFLSVDLAVAYVTHSTCVHGTRVARAMWSVETGLQESYVREVLSGGEDCFLRMSDKSEMEHRTLVIGDLWPMFLLALLLLQLATIVFIVELIIGALTQMPRRCRRCL